MKTRDYIIFFSIVLSVFGLINFYIFLRGWNAFALNPELRSILLPIFLLLAVSYPVGRMLERFTLSLISEVIVYIGAVWLGLMVYLLLGVITVDLVRVANAIVPFFPSFITQNFALAQYWTAWTVLGLSVLITAAGFINARFPVVRKLELTVPKKNSALSSLRIAAASDIHLGTIMRQRRLRYIVDKINSLNADAVLLPGDVFDEDIGKVIKNNLGDILKTIRSTYGTFAVTGNHEYFGGVEHAVKYLRDHGITVLRDEAVSIGGAVTLAGREDISFNRWMNRKRKSLAEILATVPEHLPTVVLDHQPFKLSEPTEAKIDLQLSGHTHHGQIWPFNFISKKVYELSWGFKKKDQSHFYVSCGAGSWGPPIRTGNRPEILDITLQFQ
jgi:predicted MPP superfamily phosphohydrolase